MKPGPNDVVCQRGGKVSFSTPPSGRRAARKLQPETTIRTDRGGLAQVAFKREALCEFGPLPTEVVTRYGGPSRLFLQREGNAICSLGRKVEQKLPFFCDESVQCPVLVTTSGPFALRVEGGLASTSSLAPGERRVVMVLCSGSYAVRVERDFGYSESAGSTSSLNRVRIVLVETANEIHLSTESVPAPRVCRGRVIRRHTDVFDL